MSANKAAQAAPQFNFALALEEWPEEERLPEGTQADRTHRAELRSAFSCVIRSRISSEQHFHGFLSTCVRYFPTTFPHASTQVTICVPFSCGDPEVQIIFVYGMQGATGGIGGSVGTGV